MTVRASQFMAACRAACAGALALMLAACSGTGLGDGPIAPIQDALRNFPVPFFNRNEEEPAVLDAVPAGRLYNEGLVLLNQNRFAAAAQRFEEVDRTHPHSDVAKRAVLMVAYSRYQQGSYDLAAAAAERYVTLHPGTPEAAYARFIMGDSHFRLIPDVARDQGRAERALQAMNEIVLQHPDTEYARAAQRRITIARDQLAGKEMDIGRYYLQQRAFGAAAGRFRVVVQNYQTTRHVEEALYRLVESYLSLGVVDEAQAAASVLGHNFPQSPWYRDAFILLQGRGLQPQANEGSWIVRAFRGLTG